MTAPSKSDIAVTSGGIPHVIYIEDDSLYHAWRDGVSWQNETVVTGKLGPGVITLDTQETPHLAFGLDHDEDFSKELFYATRENGSWNLTNVDSDDYFASDISIAVDESGTVHIGYTNLTESDDDEVRYAYSTTDGWEREIVESDPDSAAFSSCSIAVDQNGNPHLAYLGPGNFMGTGRYMYRDGSGWTQLEGFDAQVCLSLTLAGQNEVPTVAYQTSDTGDLVVSSDSYYWLEHVLDGDYAPVSVDIGSDGNGDYHVAYHAYQDANTQAMKYAYRLGAFDESVSVDIEQVGTDGMLYPIYASTAVDGAGSAHFAYYCGGREELRYARDMKE
jgi:hypothetical protein